MTDATETEALNFDLDETQVAIADLARQIFEGSSDVDRVTEIEATDDRVDEKLWSELAKADLLGLCLPESVGGAGYGFTELSLILTEQGRRVAPVPLVPTLVLAAKPVAEFGTDEQQQRLLAPIVAGTAKAAGAFSGPGIDDPLTPRSVTATASGDAFELTGHKVAVPGAHVASWILVSAMLDGAPALFVVQADAAGLGLERNIATSREIVSTLTLEATPAQLLGSAADGADILTWIIDRAYICGAAFQIGLGEEALRMAAEYTSTREQFGRPLSTNQGVALRAADAYVRLRSMWSTWAKAVWMADAGLDVHEAALIAKWWTAEGGHEVVHVTQHLHGGMGADVDYPVHRYFLHARQNQVLLGSTPTIEGALGAVLANRVR